MEDEPISSERGWKNHKYASKQMVGISGL